MRFRKSGQRNYAANNYWLGRHEPAFNRPYDCILIIETQGQPVHARAGVDCSFPQRRHIFYGDPIDIHVRIDVCTHTLDNFTSTTLDPDILCLLTTRPLCSFSPTWRVSQPNTYILSENVSTFGQNFRRKSKVRGENKAALVCRSCVHKFLPNANMISHWRGILFLLWNYWLHFILRDEIIRLVFQERIYYRSKSQLQNWNSDYGNMVLASN